MRWTIEIKFTEDEDKTRAEAKLERNGRPLYGWGRARRNPADPDVPAIGEDLAASRALADLSHHLLENATESMDQMRMVG